MSEISERRIGERITFTTRAIANSIVDKKGMYEKILEIMKKFDKPMSAKDIAVELFKRGLTPDDSRQQVAPRLTELSRQGKIEPVGDKQRDNYSGIRVSVYQIRKCDSR